MIKKILFFVVFIGLYSCQYFKKQEVSNKDIVAKVGNNFLYKSDIQGILPSNYTLEDSVKIATNFVNSWALKKLLFAKAQENISAEKKADFEALVNEYKNDLYIQSYIEMLVASKVDTSITPSQYEEFYQENKHIFRTNEELIKLRYISVLEKETKNNKIIEKFRSFKDENKRELDSLSGNFFSSYLNDSVWIKTSEVYEKLPFLKEKLPNRSGDIYQNITHKDSTGISYFVKVNSLLKVGAESPFEYVKPTLKQIILNKRKLNYIKEIESDIINIAIKKKDFEIYE